MQADIGVMRTVNKWLSDYVLQRLLKDAGWLMGGNVLAAIIGIVTMALTARALGPVGLGVIVLVIAYTQIMNRLLTFESWQAIVKFGAHALERKDVDDLARLVKLGTLLDVISALFGTLFAVSAAPWVAGWLDLEGEQARWLALYCLVILFYFPGAPTGILRLFNRFYFLSLHKIAVAVITLVGVAVAVFLEAGAAGVLLAYAVSQVAGQIILLTAGWWALGSEGLTPAQVWQSSIRGTHTRLREIVQFVFFTNIESSVKILREMDVFIIGYLMSTEAVGLYRIAKRLAEVGHKFIDPFFYAAFPSFNKLHASGNRAGFGRLAVRSSLIVGVVVSLGWLAFVVIGEWAVTFVFGPAYAAAYPVASICMFAMVIWAFAQPLSPALYSTSGYRKAFAIHLATAVAYIAMLALCVRLTGLHGAAWSYVIFYLAWSGLMLATLIRQLRKQE